MKAHNAKMKGNEGPKGQKLEIGAGPGAATFFVWEIGKTDNFWQLGTPEADPEKAKMQGNEGPQGVLFRLCWPSLVCRSRLCLVFIVRLGVSRLGPAFLVLCFACRRCLCRLLASLF